MKFDRMTKILLGVIAAGLWALIFIMTWPQAGINNIVEASKSGQAVRKRQAADFDSLTVHRLNVVNEEGQLLWVIADSSRFPPPVISGKVGKRSISPHGILFYDTAGNEAGGIAYVKTENFRQTAMILDYRNSDGMGFGLSDNRPNNYSAGFFIRDPVPLGTNIRKKGSTNTERLAIMNDNANVYIVLRDKQGNDRIKLEVSKKGQASIQIMDTNGNVVSRIPSK